MKSFLDKLSDRFDALFVQPMGEYDDITLDSEREWIVRCEFLGRKPIDQTVYAHTEGEAIYNAVMTFNQAPAKVHAVAVAG